MESDRFYAHLPAFAGPLDLLLYLIHKNEVEIFDIPIALVLDQYLSHVRVLEQAKLVDVSVAGEFLVMAARLMEIKSRMLLPRPEETEGDEDVLDVEVDDPRASLVEQLLEYKEIKERAVLLEDVHKRRALQFDRIPPDELPEPEAVLEIGEISIWDLCSAFHRVLDEQRHRSEVKVIEFDEVPVSDVIRQLRSRFEGGEKQIRFTEIFPPGASLGHMIASFLAILEMAKLQMITFAQEAQFGDILVDWRQQPS
ncbi:MAG: segregation/condensation protein A [Planctomycetota bacterium]